MGLRDFAGSLRKHFQSVFHKSINQRQKLKLDRSQQTRKQIWFLRKNGHTKTREKMEVFRKREKYSIIRLFVWLYSLFVYDRCSSLDLQPAFRIFEAITTDTSMNSHNARIICVNTDLIPWDRINGPLAIASGIKSLPWGLYLC